MSILLVTLSSSSLNELFYSLFVSYLISVRCIPYLSHTLISPRVVMCKAPILYQSECLRTPR